MPAPAAMTSLFRAAAEATEAPAADDVPTVGEEAEGGGEAEG